LLRPMLIGAAILTAACATLPASARPFRIAHDIKTAGMYRGYPSGVARVRVNPSKASLTSPARWPVHFDDQFVLDP
jgi:hypothetical protein